MPMLCRCRTRVLFMVLVVVVFATPGLSPQIVSRRDSRELPGRHTILALRQDKRTLALQRIADATAAPILALSELPNEARDVPVGSANKNASGAHLSPNELQLAFAVSGHVSWVEIYDLSTEAASAAAFVPGGDVVRLFPLTQDRPYFAVETMGASGLRALKIVDSSEAVCMPLHFKRVLRTDKTGLSIEDVARSVDGRSIGFALCSGNRAIRQSFSMPRVRLVCCTIDTGHEATMELLAKLEGLDHRVLIYGENNAFIPRGLVEKMAAIN